MKTGGQKAERRFPNPFLRLRGGAPEPAAAATSAVGTLLCATRMRLGKDLQHVAEVLHIRYTYLVAIEDGRYEDLPGQAYAVGFVRAYADYLGLDGDEVVRRFKADSAGVQRPAMFEFPLPTGDLGVPSGALILAAIVLGMFVYGVWYSLAGSDRSAVQVIQEVPARLTAIINGAPKTETADAAPAADTPAAPADDATQTAPVDGNGNAAPEVAAADAPPAPAGDLVELHAKADVWVTLREGQKPDDTRLLHKDETFRVPQGHAVTLLTGRGRDLDILVAGKAATPPDETQFAKGVVLDPQHLKVSP